MAVLFCFVFSFFSLCFLLCFFCISCLLLSHTAQRKNSVIDPGETGGVADCGKVWGRAGGDIQSTILGTLLIWKKKACPVAKGRLGLSLSVVDEEHWSQL